MPRIVADSLFDTLLTRPAGLDTSPSQALWNKYRGEEYTVFFDESFYRFFGLSDPEGNFCYGAVGVPTSQLSVFNARMSDLLDQHYPARLGDSKREIKSTELLRLSVSAQASFVRAFANVLEEVGGFISGFYVPVNGLVLERVRVDLMQTAESVPNDHADLFRLSQQELVATLTGPNQVDLVLRMLQVPASAMANFLGWLQASFRIVYDPREKQEDEIVRAEMAKYLDIASRVSTDDSTESARYLGMDITQTSEEAVGLQAADLVAGILRKFFRDNQKWIEHGASLKLVTPASIEPLMQVVSIDGHMLKFGALMPTHPKLDRVLGRPNEANLLSYIAHLLASGVLGTLTSTGRYRGVEVYNGVVFDMND